MWNARGFSAGYHAGFPSNITEPEKPVSGFLSAKPICHLFLTMIIQSRVLSLAASYYCTYHCTRSTCACGQPATVRICAWNDRSMSTSVYAHYPALAASRVLSLAALLYSYLLVQLVTCTPLYCPHVCVKKTFYIYSSLSHITQVVQLVSCAPLDTVRMCA